MPVAISCQLWNNSGGGIYLKRKGLKIPIFNDEKLPIFNDENHNKLVKNLDFISAGGVEQ